MYLIKIGSFNARRLGAVINKKIRSPILSQNSEFLPIQETKLEQIDEAMCKQIWGYGEFNWSFCPAT